jgi:hypothetical protein
MIKNYSMRKIVILASTILLVCFILSCCSCFEESGHKKVVANKAGTKFSFEYPRTFTVDRDSFTSAEISTLVLEHFIKKSKSKEKDGTILIDYFPMVSEGLKAKSYTNYVVNALPKSTPDFVLAERTPVQVSGIDCEMISYTNRFPSGLNSDITQYWYVYFDYQGRLWHIGFASNPNLYEENRIHFMHLIQTFKFLD